MEEKENTLHEKAKRYAELQMERLGQNPKFKIEWIISNAYKKGWQDMKKCSIEKLKQCQ